MIKVFILTVVFMGFYTDPNGTEWAPKGISSQQYHYPNSESCEANKKLWLVKYSRGPYKTQVLLAECTPAFIPK